MTRPEPSTADVSAAQVAPEDAGRGIAGDTQVQIDPYTPPEMRTLVYSPDVRIIVGHGLTQTDMSADIVSVTLIRKENSVSTLFATIANKDGRYIGKADPMDKITVFMKRIKWIQVFSGYIDSGPFRQLYQGVITIKASCTLKRLLHTWWNPALSSSANYFNQMSTAQAVAGDAQYDSGLGSMLKTLLIEVGGWSPASIHIANFPVVFYNFLVSQIYSNQAANQAQVSKFRHLLLGDDARAGPGRNVGYKTSAGAPGPPVVGSEGYVPEIISVVDDMGMGPRTAKLSTAEGIIEAAGTGQEDVSAFSNNADSKAWEQFEDVGTSMQTNAMNNDAAILAVAAAMATSGLRNLGSPSVPDSLRYAIDGVGIAADAVGLFGQPSSADYGTLSQRMNPRQSTRMFLSRLKQLNWRNMNPGDAIFQVQHSGSPAEYDGFMEEAQQMVKPYREASENAAAQAGVAPGIGEVSSVAGAAGVNTSTDVSGVIGDAADVTSPESLAAQAGLPDPDASNAIATALAQVGKPYEWGAKGPAAFDCSGLVAWAYRSIGIDLSGSTYTQKAKLAGHEVPVELAQPGDLIFTEGGGHVQMYIGGGQVVEAYTSGAPVSVRPADMVGAVGGVAYHVADYGGPNPANPPMDPALVGPGVAPGTGVASTGLGGGAVGTPQEGIARNLFQYIFDPGQFSNSVADLWAGAGGHKDFIDAQPLIQMVQSVCTASMRNFQSAPNGDFVAYYPDQFGLDGKPATVNLEDIELKNVHINVSDDNLATHVYVAGQPTMLGQLDQVTQWLDTAGTATVEDEWLFQRLRMIGLGDYKTLTGQQLMSRFGVRPYQISTTLAGSHELEFLLACQTFIEKWASQYETQVSFTFMPELFPGMRINLANHNIQLYVSEVTHQCDFEHGFSTSAVIQAPSNPNAHADISQVQTDALGPELGISTIAPRI